MGCRKTGSEYYASLFDGNGDILLNIPLPGRGHGIISSPTKEQAIVFARRPGTYAYSVDLTSGEIAHEITATAGRHFYGHGAISTNGKHLYTSENDIEGGTGIIGVRDSENGYALIAAYPSGGIGPHEIGLMPDGETLAIANGGILTKPELGRAKLNLDTMVPSLALMNRHTGNIQTNIQLAPEHHQLSIRHMSISPAGLALALQYEGPKSHHMPLLARFDGSSLKLIDMPQPLARAMRNYAGSITHDPSGQIIALACPRGNLISFWDANTFSALGTQSIRDVCGIAPGNHPGEFLITGGTEMRSTSPFSLQPAMAFANTQWDNHLTRIA